MDFKKIITSLCILSVILLFVQCEKEDIIVKKEYQSFTDAIQDASAKKPDNPDKPGDDPTNVEHVVISGDVVGEGDASTSVKEYSPFTLTLKDPFPADIHDGEIRILYGTKKKSENRIDFIYTDTDGKQKKLIIWDGVYDGSTLILDGCPALIGVVDQPEYTDYTPASAIVEFSYEPPPED
jgi:hypothetical protein